MTLGQEFGAFAVTIREDIDACGTPWICCGRSISEAPRSVPASQPIPATRGLWLESLRLSPPPG